MEDPKPKAIVSSKPHMRFDRRNAAIGVLVLAILLSAGIWWVARMNDHTRQSPVNKPSQVIHDALYKKDGASTSELQAALKNNPTKDEKIQLLQFLAGDSEKHNDYKTAVDYLKQAYSAGLNDANLTMNIGMIYLEKLQDKSQALKYLRIAQSLIQGSQSQTAQADNTKTFLAQKIKELEDQGVKAAG